MVNYPRIFKDRGIGYIFDPGQSLPVLAAADVANAIDGCRILIANDYELEMIMKKIALDKRDLIRRAGTVIVTLGEKGSQVITADGEINIPAVKPKKVEDPTGAGDAYRGGLISGLIQDKDIEECARMGSVCASFAVECYGTQDYRFGPEGFAERLKGSF
jgi:adenosine kinase